MDKMKHTKETIDKYLGYLLAAIMGLMVIDVVWGVMVRYLLNSPSSFTDELARYFLIWVGLLGAALAAGKQMHLAIDILPNKLEPEGQKRLNILIEIIIFLFALSILVIGGVRLVYITLTLGQASPSLGIPLGYVYIVLPLSGLLIMYYSVINIILALKKVPENSPA